MRCFAWHEHRTVLVCATVRHCAGCCRAVIAALRAPSPTTVLARNGLVSVPRHYRHQCDTQCQQCRHVLLQCLTPIRWTGARSLVRVLVFTLNLPALFPVPCRALKRRLLCAPHLDGVLPLLLPAVPAVHRGETGKQP